MNNIIITLKRFFQNKNTVTILGVIVIIGLLYFGYNNQIEKQVRPVRNIPIASQDIQPRTLITEEMITYIDIAPIVLQNNVMTQSNLVVGMYTNYNSVVPKGSMFYSNVLVKKEELPDAAFEKVKEGEVVVRMDVDINTTYGNSIFPGNKIDIYMKAETLEGQLIVGKLLENVEVIAVKDSSGNHVFENTTDRRTPSTLIFGLIPEYNILFLKAKYLVARSVELFPVPHGGTVPKTGATHTPSQNLKDMINAESIPNDELIESEAPSIEDENDLAGDLNLQGSIDLPQNETEGR